MIDRDFGSYDGFAKTFAAVTAAVAVVEKARFGFRESP